MTAVTLLLRQVHPNFVQNGFASSAAFRPNETDNGLMSVYDHDLITAEAAWLHYTNVLLKKSAGAAAVSVEECLAESLPPRPDTQPFPEHAVIDFKAVEGKQWRSKSKKLQAKALARGWSHFAEQV